MGDFELDFAFISLKKKRFHLGKHSQIWVSGVSDSQTGPKNRGERERLFGSREREGKLKITFPIYGKGTGIRKCYGKGREWEI